MAAGFKFFVAIALGVASALFGGYTFALLWTWFIVPVFGVPSVSVGQAIGISIFLGLLAIPFIVYLDKDYTDRPSWIRPAAVMFSYAICIAVSAAWRWVFS